MQDETQKTEALNFKLFAMRSNLKNREDSINCINQFKELYAQDPTNEVVLDGLYSMYDGMKDREAQKALLDNHLAKYPDSFTATAEKGMMAIADNNAEEGANWLRKAAALKPDNAVVQTYLGTCLNVIAGNSDDPAKRKTAFEEAVQALDKAKELDPDKAQANWGYNRYQAYYGLYGEDDARTKAAEADMR
jgi:tetratricopeptide (TPR) repeat protein